MLADRLPREVLPTLANQYASCSSPNEKTASVVGSGRKVSPELRIKIGEVIVKTCRNMGQSNYFFFSLRPELHLRKKG